MQPQLDPLPDGGYRFTVWEPTVDPTTHAVTQYRNGTWWGLVRSRLSPPPPDDTELYACIYATYPAAREGEAHDGMVTLRLDKL